MSFTVYSYVPVSETMLTLNGEPWIAAKARKATACAIDGCEIKPGDMVIRPFGNRHNRMLRINAQHFLANPTRGSDLTLDEHKTPNPNEAGK